MRLMDNPARLQAAAVNLGARAGAPSRDILIRCDAHAAYPDRFLLDVAEALEAKGSDSLVVPMDATEEPGGAGCFQRANAWIVDTPARGPVARHIAVVKSPVLWITAIMRRFAGTGFWRLAAMTKPSAIMRMRNMMPG